MESVSFLQAYENEKGKIENALKAIGYQLCDIGIEWYDKGMGRLDKLPGFIINIMPITAQD